MSGPFFFTNGITQLSRMNIEAAPEAKPCASCLSAQSSDFFGAMQMIDVIEQRARGGVDILRNRHLHGAGLRSGLEHLHAGKLVVEVAEFLRAAGRAGEAQRDAGARKLAVRASSA